MVLVFLGVIPVKYMFAGCNALGTIRRIKQPINLKWRTSPNISDIHHLIHVIKAIYNESWTESASTTYTGVHEVTVALLNWKAIPLGIDDDYLSSVTADYACH